MFVRKMCTFNVDEIETRQPSLSQICYFECQRTLNYAQNLLLSGFSLRYPPHAYLVIFKGKKALKGSRQ